MYVHCIYIYTIQEHHRGNITKSGLALFYLDAKSLFALFQKTCRAIYNAFFGLLAIALSALSMILPATSPLLLSPSKICRRQEGLNE